MSTQKDGIADQMPEPSEAEKLAFGILYEASEKVRALGINGPELWLVLFSELDNLMASDLGMGGDRHKAAYQQIVDEMTKVLTEWDDPIQ